MSTNSKQQSCLALMAHADDETLGAGGTLAKLSQNGWRVDVVFLSDGVVQTRGDTVQDNRHHGEEACQRLGLNVPVYLGFRDQKFDTYAMADIAGAVGELGLSPDLIVTHVDTDLNQDHRITLEAAKIIGRPRQKPVSILGVEIPKTSFWNTQTFAPNYYVDITDTLSTKIHAFEAYAHEKKPFPHAFSTEMIELLATYHGAHAGFGKAEAFKIYRGYEGRLP